MFLEEVISEGGTGLSERLLASEAAWTLLLASVVLGIGQSFESMEHALKKRLPDTLKPVLSAVIGEITTVGFSALVVSTLQSSGVFDKTLNVISEQCLGERELLLEIFESIERALFPAVMSFVAACTVVIGIVTVRFETFAMSMQKELLLAKLAEDSEREECVVDEESESCRLARYRSQKTNGLLLSSLAITSVDARRSSPLDAFEELFRSAADWRAEFLRFRARFIEQSAAEFGVALPEASSSDGTCSWPRRRT